MLKTRSLIALTIVAALFFVTGVQVFSYAQMSNETSTGGNMTNATMGGNMTGNMTGNISGLGKTTGP